jgi:hypothetical protein
MMDNGIVDPEDIKPKEVPQVSEEQMRMLEAHTIDCMRVAYTLLGEQANTEPGENMDQLTLILAKLSPADIKELLIMFEVPGPQDTES